MIQKVKTLLEKNLGKCGLLEIWRATCSYSSLAYRMLVNVGRGSLFNLGFNDNELGKLLEIYTSDLGD